MRSFFSFLAKGKNPLTILGASWVVFVMLLVPTAVVRADEATSPADVVEVVAGAAEGACVAGGIVGSPCPQTGIKETLRSISRKVLSPGIKVTLLTAVLELAEFVLDNLAYKAAVAIASAGAGQTPLYQETVGEDAWREFGLDVAAEHLGVLSGILEDIDIEFDLCAPKAPEIRLAVQLGIRSVYQPPQPRCEWREVQANWEGFIQEIQASTEDPTSVVLAQMAQSFRPGADGISSVVNITTQTLTKVNEKKAAEFQQSLADDGFKNVTDFVSGAVKTPSSTVKEQFNKTLSETTGGEGLDASVEAITNNPDLLLQLLGHTASTFVSTLLSQVMNNVYNGLFDTRAVETDLFNPDRVSISGRERAQQRFSDLVSTTPATVSNYNLLSEFIVCPAGISNRQINNCVMDANLSTAITRSAGGEFVTLRKAVDEGLMQGGWRLYGPDDPENSDPFCYTYGYCYGNIVKMRKARILPVGVELAAQIAQQPELGDQPVTLRDVLDGFNDCSADGQWDVNHPWCHLVDPEWILKYPETQCRAYVNGELLINQLAPGRGGVCTDAPSCIAEDASGNCVGGFGYCLQEENIWRFRGDECPSQYATCLALTNTDSNAQASYLLRSVDVEDCTSQNAGCTWYRTNKYEDDQGTPELEDDQFAFLAGDDVYAVEEVGDVSVSEDRDAAVQTNSSSRPTYGYDTDSDGTDDFSYATYAYEDRVYFNGNVQQCVAEAAGCQELFAAEDQSLNLLRNPSFEVDEDNNGVADNWSIGAPAQVIYDADTADAAQHGSASYQQNASTITQGPLELSQAQFYTLSYYAKREASTPFLPEARLAIYTDTGLPVNLSGYSRTCDLVGVNLIKLSGTDLTTSYQRFECNFTTVQLPDPRTKLQAYLVFQPTSQMRIDSVQLEPGAVAADFHDGYLRNNAPEYLRLPPAWLGCTGALTDPAECAQYAGMCSATEVGCDSFTPLAGGPAVPAIGSDADRCPAECVGFAAFKQEATLYDSEDFPVYFIADTARSCSAQQVGCDQFTNLETEAIESYTLLRACVTPQQSTGATFYTWEGSDASGYQLRSFTLLGSNVSGGTVVYTQDANANGIPDVDEPALNIDEDQYPQLAPCSNWDVQSETELTCADSISELREDDECNEHADIFSNPDCREFYDAQGHVHYRRYSATVSVDAACTPYRKTLSTQGDCDASGGFWTAAGECRYFGLALESLQCPNAAVGCRAYTGPAGSNSATILFEGFEEGTYEPFTPYPPIGSTVSAALSVSNESVATDGHSLEVLPTGIGGGAATVHAWFNPADHDDTCATEGGCEIAGFCTVPEGEASCGALVDQLVPEKTYFVRFWAKGDGNLSVAFVENAGLGAVHDIVSPSASAVSGGWASAVAGLSSVELTPGWSLYELGPLDTAQDGFENFDENAIVIFGDPSGGAQIYLDNVEIVEAEDNITVIKESWVTPAACERTPEGIPTDPPYYLGCEAYEDQDGQQQNFYRFSQLCSERAVGCEAFYQSQQSESPYAQAFNVTCLNSDADSDGTPDLATDLTDCAFAGSVVCQIAPQEDSCLFDYDGPLGTLPSHIQLGPEARVVSGDSVVYAVGQEAYACEAASAGCTELGVPVWSQDRTVVTGFESTYLINDPDQYATTLCSGDELFCSEWAHEDRGNFYFRDPGEHACEYKTNVTVGASRYSGWFRAGTNEFCYGTGICSEDAAVSCETDADCAVAGKGRCEITQGSYLVAGQDSRLWYNGDGDYAGWVGVCDATYDSCTEFVDPLQTAGTASGSYTFLNNDKVSDESLSSSDRCNGQVSLSQGCALFNDITNTQLSYAASPSYLRSERADDIQGDEPGALVQPVDCTDPDGGIFTVNAVTVDICEQRCRYVATGGATLDLAGAVAIPGSDGSTTTYYANACLDQQDCPSLTNSFGDTVTGSCATDALVPRFSDDSNLVLKVNRDRQCSEWLSCSSSQAEWDPQSASYRQVCERVDVCSQYSASGDASFCTRWEQNPALVLDVARYASRDVSWAGVDYAGYSIPDQLPVETYSQINVNPQRACVDADGNVAANAFGGVDACAVEADCAADEDCEELSADYRLVYAAGACEVDNGAACTVGFCENSGAPCVPGAAASACGSGEQCVTGICQYQGSPTVSCDGSEDCPSNRPQCVSGVCVDSTISFGDSAIYCTAVADCIGSTNGSPYELFDGVACATSSLTKNGACFNEQCLLTIEGEEFALEQSEQQICRGYPEVTSPFSTEIVTEWTDPSNVEFPVSLTEITNEGVYDAIPRTYIYGFSGNDTCSAVCNEFEDADNDNILEPDECVSATLSDGCVCEYEKVQFGNGAVTKYYPPNTDSSDIPTGICSGGPFQGKACLPSVDATTQCGEGGNCVAKTKEDAFVGWFGYCIERDSSIHVNGDPTEQACLSWLPVDRLSGQTDLYAKYTSAGFPLTDTYVCSEVGYFRDYFVTGAVWNSAGDAVTSVHPVCAEAVTDDFGNPGYTWEDEEYEQDAGCDAPEYDSCWGNAQCPNGYIALVGHCDSVEAQLCDDGADDDCPYMCVPMYSYNYETGAKCDMTLADGEHQGHAVDIINEHGGLDDDDSASAATDSLNDLESVTLDDVEGFYANPEFNVSMWGTPVYMIGDIASSYNDALDVMGGSYSVGYRKCVARGIPARAGSAQASVGWEVKDENTQGWNWDADNGPPYATPNWNNFYAPSEDGPNQDDYAYAAPGRSAGAPQNNMGYYNLDYLVYDQSADAGSIREYLGCYEIAQVASSDPNGGNPNKAWTHRLWENVPDALTNLFTTQASSNFGTPFGIRASTTPTVGGRALFGEYYNVGDEEATMIGVQDAWPLPVLSCRDSDDTLYALGPSQIDQDSVCSANPYPTNTIFPDALQDGDTAARLAVPYELLTAGNYTTMQSSPFNSEPSIAGTSSNQTAPDDPDIRDSLADTVSQMFAKIYKVYQYKFIDGSVLGKYEKVTSIGTTSDFSNDGDTYGGPGSANYGVPEPPTVASVGQCFGTLCREDEEDKFTVNGQDSGNVFGAAGSRHITVKFFAWADSNQMPIKNVIVDWGSDADGNSDQTGSIALNNFYRNHRGLLPNSQTEGKCSASAAEFGLTPEACETAYFNFENDYFCQDGSIDVLPTCSVDSDGKLAESPCTGGPIPEAAGACVFQPRVFVKDNWGWCTGVCTSNPGDSTPECYGNECLFQYCPSGGDNPLCSDSTGGVTDPWVYYDGFVIVQP